MKNFSFTKKVVVVAGLLALCAGQFDAFGSKPDIENDGLNGKSSKQIVRANTNVSDSGQIYPTQIISPNEVLDFCVAKFLKMTQFLSSLRTDRSKPEKSSERIINVMNDDVLKLIFTHVRNVGGDPRCLPFVCKCWNSIMQRPFLEECLKTYNPFQLEKQFYNAVLRYTSPDDGKVVEMKFSEAKKDGRLDLANYDKVGDSWAIITNMASFSVKEGNEGKMMLLIILPQKAKKGIYAGHPLEKLVEVCPKENPIMLFKWWKDPMDLRFVYYLITANMQQISQRNVYENWACAVMGIMLTLQGASAQARRAWGTGQGCENLHVCF
jgi:hypothetical protein